MRVRARTIVLSLLAAVALLVLVAITMVGWQVVLGPRARPVTDRKFEVTEARMARGKYLVEGPATCFHCHSEHDFSTPQFLTPPARKGAGWHMPIPELGRSSRRTSPRIGRPALGGGQTTRSRGRCRRACRRTGARCFRSCPT